VVCEQELINTAQSQAKQNRKELTAKIFQLKSKLLRASDQIVEAPRVKDAVLSLGREWSLPTQQLDERNITNTLQHLKEKMRQQVS